MPYVQLDITDDATVEKVISEVNPDAVIHCAAWTAVDMAEDDANVAKVRAVNAGGTQNIANACKKLGCKMTYIGAAHAVSVGPHVPKNRNRFRFAQEFVNRHVQSFLRGI